MGGWEEARMGGGEETSLRWHVGTLARWPVSPPIPLCAFASLRSKRDRAKAQRREARGGHCGAWHGIAHDAGRCGHPQAVPRQTISYDHHCPALRGIAYDGGHCRSMLTVTRHRCPCDPVRRGDPCGRPQRNPTLALSINVGHWVTVGALRGIDDQCRALRAPTSGAPTNDRL